MKTRMNNHSLFTLTLILASIACLAGCGGADPEYGTLENPLTVDTRIVNMGAGEPALDRYVQETWGTVCELECTDWVMIDAWGGHQQYCLSWENVCQQELQAIKLFMSEQDMNQGIIFKHFSMFLRMDMRCSDYDHEVHICFAYEVFPVYDTYYLGCGRKAAQNALRWFDIIKSQGLIAGYVEGHSYEPFSDNIATYPGELRSGLQELLNRYGRSNIQAKRYSHKPLRRVREHLRNGFPVIGLVNNGSHWVVISGWDKNVGYYIQNMWSSYWSDNVSLDIDGANGFWADIDGTTYEEGTFITFDFVD